jgi:hypothetical protein
MNLKNFQNLLSGSALVAPVLGTIASLFIASPTYSVPLGNYTFSGNLVATSVDPGITLTPITVGSGLGNFSTASDSLSLGNFSLLRSVDQAIADNDVISFTLGLLPATASTSLNSISFLISRPIGGPNFLALRSSLTGDTNLFNPTTILTPSITYNLSDSPTFQNITTPTTFTLIGSGALGLIANNRNLTLDNIVIDGTVTPVPYEFETAAGLLVFGGYFAGKRYLKNKVKAKA